MQLEPLYTVIFTTPEAWSVEVAAEAGIEGRAFLRADGALVPEFRGVLETDDGATILFEWQGLAVLTDSGMRQLLGSLVHTTSDPRYRWLNDRVCAVEGEVRPRTDGSGYEVALEVLEMVWEGVG